MRTAFSPGPGGGPERPLGGAWRLGVMDFCPYRDVTGLCFYEMPCVVQRDAACICDAGGYRLHTAALALASEGFDDI